MSKDQVWFSHTMTKRVITTLQPLFWKDEYSVPRSISGYILNFLSKVTIYWKTVRKDLLIQTSKLALVFLTGVSISKTTSSSVKRGMVDWILKLPRITLEANVLERACHCLLEMTYGRLYGKWEKLISPWWLNLLHTKPHHGTFVSLMEKCIPADRTQR